MRDPRGRSAFGGMISIELKGGLEDSRRFLERCQVFALAESLGGVESLIEHPAIMTHASVPSEARAALGITDTLCRLSVGIEVGARTCARDLEQASGLDRDARDVSAPSSARRGVRAAG